MTITKAADREAAAGPLLTAALQYAAAGWPVFPCTPDGTPAPDHKAPLTRSGFKDATTDPGQIRAWWARWPAANVAVATGAPGPDVLDVDNHDDGNGFGAFNRLKRAGMLTGACALVTTRSGGLHAYYAGTGQPCGRLPALHLDFKATGGYVIAPPSVVLGRSYELAGHRPAAGRLDWAKVRALLDPPNPAPGRPGPPRHPAGSPHGWPASQRATATVHCSGPRAGPPNPATPAPSKRWPAPQCRPACPKPRHGAPSRRRPGGQAREPRRPRRGARRRFRAH